MSRMLLYCRRGCRSAFIHRLTTLINAEKTRASTFINLDRPYDRVAHVMNMTVGAVPQVIRRCYGNLNATTKWTWWRMASLSTTRVGCMHVRTCLSEYSSATIWLKRE